MILVLGLSCSNQARRVEVPDREGAYKTAAVIRAQRRAYDGAPPTIPHGVLGAACLECHHRTGMAVAELGFAPPSPHSSTDARFQRCVQCHVRGESSLSGQVTVATRFVGLAQDLRHGPRAHSYAPPRIPHSVLLRENCHACHDGPAARREIRTSHPERARCQQCHLEITTQQKFHRTGGG